MYIWNNLLNTHKQIKVRSLKTYTVASLNRGILMINFPIMNNTSKIKTLPIQILFNA